MKRPGMTEPDCVMVMTEPGSPGSRKHTLPYRGRRVLWGVIFPALVTGAAALLVFSWLPRLPDPVALQWDDEITRAGPVSEFLWTTGAAAVVSMMVLAVISLTAGRTSFVRRLVLGLAAGLSVFFAGLALAPIAVQLDAEAGSTPEGLDVGLLVTATLALTAGAAAALTAGDDPRVPATRPVTGERGDLDPGGGAVWSKRVTPSPPLLVWVSAAAAVYAGVMGWASWAAGSWFMLLLTVLPVAPLPAILIWEVRVDPSGLTARSTAGRPRLHIPAEEVEGAAVRDVESPFGEFGGWGIRAPLGGPSGTLGVIIRGGEAVEVSRSAQRRVVVTVDDAATAAKLLNAHAQRSRSSETRQ